MLKATYFHHGTYQLSEIQSIKPLFPLSRSPLYYIVLYCTAHCNIRGLRFHSRVDDVGSVDPITIRTQL